MDEPEPVRILVAADDPADAELVVRELHRAGIAFDSRRVGCERDFLVGLDELNPHVVISGFRSGVFDLRQLSRIAIDARAAVPVIIVTGSDDEEAAVAGIESGARDNVIVERLGRLGSAVRAALERGRLQSDAVRGEDLERQLVRAVEQSPAPIMITDVDGRIEYVNPSLERASGYASQELVGRNPRILKSGLTPPQVYRAMWTTIASGEIWRGELQNRRKDGSLYWQRASISAVRDAGGRISRYLAIAEDVTASKRAEQAVRATDQQLLLAQRMEAIGRLAGGIAHAFNNLLSVILGQGERLLQEVGGDTQRERAQQIVRSAHKIASLTQQLLAFGRRQVLEPRVLRLDAVVNEARGMLQRVVGEDIDLEVVPSPKLGNVRADATQLVQVLVNLAVNARGTMPHGGRLTVEFQDVVLDERYAASHPPCRPGPYVMMAVTDTGQGIAPDVQRRIFEPFFPTKPEGVGTGMGLSTVYGIVKQSGGFVWVYSELGVGTSFKVYFPRIDAVEQAQAADESPAPRPAGAHLARVLLVEDDDGVRELMADVLETEGYIVVASGCPADALALAEQHEEFDLLITDMIMPGMNGRDLAHLLLEKAHVARVLYVSGYTGEVLARHGGIERGERFLQKPFSQRALVTAASETLAGPSLRPPR